MSTVACPLYRRAIHYYVRTYAKISGVRKFCDFSYVLFTIDSYEFSYVRAAHYDRITGVVVMGVFVYFRSKTACLLICRKNVKIRKFDHLIACNDYLAQFLVLKYAFPIKEVLLRNSRKETWTRYVLAKTSACIALYYRKLVAQLMQQQRLTCRLGMHVCYD